MVAERLWQVGDLHKKNKMTYQERKTPAIRFELLSSAALKQYEDSKLSNEELLSKIHKQLEREKLERQNFQPCPEWIEKLDWNKLIQTKLFNNSK